MKRIEIDKLDSSAEDCYPVRKVPMGCKHPFQPYRRERSGLISVWVEDQFEQAAIEVLRAEVLKLSDPAKS